MNELKTVTQLLIPEPAETINLGDYFFQGSDLNWKNIAITQSEWTTRGYGDGERSADIATDTRDGFAISYKDLILGFELDHPGSVGWGQTEWLPEDARGFSVTAQAKAAWRDILN
jgi:hypothetical protein